jgi:hypothetical protein
MPPLEHSAREAASQFAECPDPTGTLRGSEARGFEFDCQRLPFPAESENHANTSS